MGTYKLAEVMEKPCSDLLALTPKEVCECDGTGIMEILFSHLATGDEITTRGEICTTSAECKTVLTAVLAVTSIAWTLT